MLTVKDINPDLHLSIYIAATFAKEVLHIYEEKYPEDLRPRKAIEVAEAYLRGEEVSASAADSAASVAYVAASVNTGSAGSAALSAYDAASASYAAISAIPYASNAASNAVYDSAFAATASNREEYIHERLLKMLPYILQYKIDNQQNFNNPEKVFEYLNEEQQTAALFHLDSLI